MIVLYLTSFAYFAMLWERRIGGVPVVQEDRVVDVITASDLYRLVIALEGSEQAKQKAIGALASQ